MKESKMAIYNPARLLRPLTDAIDPSISQRIMLFQVCDLSALMQAQFTKSIWRGGRPHE
jgi:hypothetical protein